VSHELVHHAQNCAGAFKGGLNTEPGYAQKDDHMRNMEKDAYKRGNMCFRDWEDQYKQGNLNESIKSKEIRLLLMLTERYTGHNTKMRRLLWE